MQVHASVKLFAIKKIDDLCENKATSVHSLLRMGTYVNLRFKVYHLFAVQNVPPEMLFFYGLDLVYVEG